MVHWGPTTTVRSLEAPRSSAVSAPVTFYQSPCVMDPDSDKPGKCTICGMDLAPVFEGQAGAPVSDGLTLGRPARRIQLDVQTSPVSVSRCDGRLRLAGTLDGDDTRHRVLSAYVEGPRHPLHHLTAPRW